MYPCGCMGLARSRAGATGDWPKGKSFFGVGGKESPAPRPAGSRVWFGLVLFLICVIMCGTICTLNGVLWISVQNTLE